MQGRSYRHPVILVWRPPALQTKIQGGILRILQYKDFWQTSI